MTAPSSTATSEYTWVFEKVSSVANQVLLMDSATGASVSGETYYINRDEAVTVEELGIVASFVSGQSLNQSVSWYSLNTSVVSIDSTTGTMMAHVPSGVATIRVKHIHNGVEYSDTFTIVVNKQMIQFMDNLGALYDVAYSYENGNQIRAFETMFNFIRGQKYNDSRWQGVAGDWNTAFMNYVISSYPALYSYFICTSGSMEFMVSDTCSNSSIDVPHLAATLNRLFYTGDTYFEGKNTFHLIDDEVDALSGWAGDCQMLIKQYLGPLNDEEESSAEKTTETFDEVYDAFYPMIGKEPSEFGYADVITDVDACNLFPLLCDQSITTGQQLEDVLYGYYYGTTGNVAAKRFTTWIGSYTIDTLKYKFFAYCTNRSYIFFQEWPFLRGYNISDVQQDAFSQAFAYYFWLQKEKE